MGENSSSRSLPFFFFFHTTYNNRQTKKTRKMNITMEKNDEFPLNKYMDTFIYNKKDK